MTKLIKYFTVYGAMICAVALISGCACCKSEAKKSACGMACCADGKTTCETCPKCSAKK